MRTIELNLNQANPTSGKISFKEGETNVLLELQRFPNLTTVYYTLTTGAGGITDRQATTADLFVRLCIQNYLTLEVDRNFAANESLRGAIYIGNWSEILVMDIERNINFVYQDADNENNFRIGLRNYTHLNATKDTQGNYELNLVIATNGGAVLKHGVLPKSSTAAPILSSLHNRILKNMDDHAQMKWRDSRVKMLHDKTFELLRNY